VLEHTALRCSNAYTANGTSDNTELLIYVIVLLLHVRFQFRFRGFTKPSSRFPDVICWNTATVLIDIKTTSNWSRGFRITTETNQGEDKTSLTDYRTSFYKCAHLNSDMRHYLRSSHEHKRHLASSVDGGRPGYCAPSAFVRDRGGMQRNWAPAGDERELRKSSICFTGVAIFTLLAAVFWLSYVLRSNYVITWVYYQVDVDSMWTG